MTETTSASYPAPDQTADKFGGQADYFTFYEREDYYLPDGISFVTLQAMSEGARAKFQSSTQRDMVLEKSSGNARFRIDQAVERRELLKASIVNWNFRRGEELVPFSERALAQFLDTANPKIVELIESKIRKMNPWMLADLSVEEIDKQIEELQEMRRTKIEAEAGEGASAGK